MEEVADVTMAISGLAMLFFGIKWSVQSFTSKAVLEFPLTSIKNTFEIVEEGLYSLCIVGGGDVENSGTFGARVYNTKNGEEIRITERLLKYRFYRNSKVSTEYLQFRINKSGNYVIEFDNIDALVVQESMVWTMQLFQKSLPAEKVRILIRHTLSIQKQLFGVLFLVFGFYLSIMGIASFVHIFY